MTRIHKEKVDVNTYRTFQDQPEANPRNDSSYEVLSVSDVLRDTAKRWTYPVPKERIPEALQPGTIAYPVDQHNFPRSFCPTISARRKLTIRTGCTASIRM